MCRIVLRINQLQCWIHRPKILETKDVKYASQTSAYYYWISYTHTHVYKQTSLLSRSSTLVLHLKEKRKKHSTIILLIFCIYWICYKNNFILNKWSNCPTVKHTQCDAIKQETLMSSASYFCFYQLKSLISVCTVIKWPWIKVLLDFGGTALLLMTHKSIENRIFLSGFTAGQCHLSYLLY